MNTIVAQRQLLREILDEVLRFQPQARYECPPADPMYLPCAPSSAPVGCRPKVAQAVHQTWHSKRWSPGGPRRASGSDRSHGCRESPLGSKAHPGRIGKIKVSGFRQDRGQIYASVSQPGPKRDVARVPDAACIGHLGLRLFLRSDGPVPDASRLLRHPTRKQRNPPR